MESAIELTACIDKYVEAQQEHFNLVFDIRVHYNSIPDEDVLLATEKEDAAYKALHLALEKAISNFDHWKLSDTNLSHVRNAITKVKRFAYEQNNESFFIYCDTLQSLIQPLTTWKP